MEYVDNSIDDAESLFRESGEHQSYGTKQQLKIRVEIHRAQRAVHVHDNAGGMDARALVDLVHTVGESQKKSVPWLNGQFGFGVHAFRAAAQRLRVVSARDGAGDALEIVVDRDRDQVDEPRAVQHEGSSSGTHVALEEMDKEWFDDVTAQDVADEIEHHFERLLSRPNLVVQVLEFDQAGELVFERRCQPFDYSKVKGTEFRRTFDVAGRQVSVQLKVSDHEYAQRTARFFSLGRRINNVCDVASFMKVSAFKQSLWAHPQLIGFIDVDDCVQPVITRDEFKQTPARRELYKELLALEPAVQKSLESELDKQRVLTLMKLEEALGAVLKKIVQDDRRMVRTGSLDLSGSIGDATPAGSVMHDGDDAAAASSTAAKAEPTSEAKAGQPKDPNTPKKPKAPQRVPIGIRLSNLPVAEDGSTRRSQMVGNVIEINAAHPDFQSRLKTRRGVPKLTDRLSAYLATVVVSAYKDHFYDEQAKDPDRSQVYADLLRDSCRLETALRRRMPALQRSLNAVFREGVSTFESEKERLRAQHEQEAQ